MVVVEFTGPTSSGKSTLVRELGNLAKTQGLSVLMITDGARDERESPEITDLNLHGRKTDLHLGFGLLSAAVKYLYVVILILMCSRDVKLVRLTLRRLALLEYLRRKPYDAVFWDEGPTHLLHNVLVVRDHAPNRKWLRLLLRHLPAPDLLVLKMESLETLLQRAHSRPDLTHRAGKGKEIDRFVSHAFELYRELEHAHLRERPDRHLWVSSDRSENAQLLSQIRLKVHA